MKGVLQSKFGGKNPYFVSEFLGIPPDSESRGLGVKVAVIDMELDSSSYSDEQLDGFSRAPTLGLDAEACHTCGKEIKLSKHGMNCGLLIAGREHKTSLGTVRGISPDCDLHIYSGGCSDCARKPEYVYATLENSMGKEVRVLSLSTGSDTEKTKICFDTFGIDTLKAFEKGLLVCTSAGNQGPASRSLSVQAVPWTLVVGDCRGGKILSSCLELAVSKTLKLPDGWLSVGGKSCGDYEIILKMKIPFNKLDSTEHFCTFLIDKNVKMADMKDNESILAYKNRNKTIMALRPYDTKTKDWPGKLKGCFAVKLTVDETRTLLKWLEMFPDDLFLRKTDGFDDDSRSCFASKFSSRGPSRLHKEFIMPDVLAPGGVITLIPPEIISNPLERSLSKLFSEGYIEADTSLSCAVVAGVAALILEKYPSWGPSAVKSAIITSATQVPGTEFTFGAGVVDTVNALNPGLIYEENAISFERYMSGDSIDNLNLPAIAAHFPASNIRCERIFVRKVKYVGAIKPVTYKSDILYSNKTLDPNVEITVAPKQLTFAQNGDVKEFCVIAKVSPHPGGYISALLQWCCDNKSLPSVRSPIHFYEK